MWGKLQSFFSFGIRWSLVVIFIPDTVKEGVSAWIGKESGSVFTSRGCNWTRIFRSCSPYRNPRLACRYCDRKSTERRGRIGPLHRIQEVPGSYFDPKTGCPDWRFLRFFPRPSRHTTGHMQLDHDRVFPRDFNFISFLYSLVTVSLESM
jgi:hypothetical protein